MENPKPSSGTDRLSEIEELARELDEINAQPDAKKVGGRGRSSKRKTESGRATARDADTGEEKEVEELPPDPEFQFMLQHGINKGFDFARDRMDMLEPGSTTRTRVGGAFTRLLGHYAPVNPGPLADLFTILGYLLFWFIVGRPEKEDDANGQTTGALTDGNNR